MARKEDISYLPKEVLLQEYLRSLILNQGKIKENGILDVTAFLNHQIDPLLMRSLGEVIAEKFRNYSATKILTAESSGIAPALGTAMALGIPCIFAKKALPVTLGKTYQTSGESHTKGMKVAYFVDTRVLGPEDKVLIVDDFLASGGTIRALVEICQQANACVVGIATAIEKSFEGGRQSLARYNIPIYSVVTITSMDENTGEFTFSED